MSKTDEPNTTSLPLWIAAGCLVAGVGLFFGNSVPALRERDELQQVEDDLVDLRRRYEAAIAEARLSGAGGESEPIDLQSLFVAIDQKGLTISEFCAAWPVEDADPGDPGTR